MANEFFTAAQALPTGLFKSASPAFTAPEFEVDPMSSAFASGSVLDAGTSSPTKPGWDFPISEGWLGANLLMESVANAINAYQGQPPTRGMAGQMVSDYNRQMREDQRLEKLMKLFAPADTQGIQNTLAAAMAPSVLKTKSPLGNLSGFASASYS